MQKALTLLKQAQELNYSVQGDVDMGSGTRQMLRIQDETLSALRERLQAMRTVDPAATDE